MRFDAAAARLLALPDVLPSPAAMFMPVLADRLDRPARRGGGDPREQTGTGDPEDSGEAGDGRPGRAAAVLVLIFPDTAGDARVVLIERPTYDGHHSGEVSFPGGKAEPEDVDPTATALREAAEEVGLRPTEAGVQVVGLLDPLWIPVSDFRVTPVLALAARAPVLVARPEEVARILEAPLDRFLPEARTEVVERTVGAWPLHYGHYELDGLSVWGATARVLSQLGRILSAD